MRRRREKSEKRRNDVAIEEVHVKRRRIREKRE